jgi:hypothetical protein
VRYPPPAHPLPPPCSPLAPTVKARNVVAYRPTETASRKQLMSTVSVEVQALVPRGNIIPPVVLAKGTDTHRGTGRGAEKRSQAGGVGTTCPWMDNGALTYRPLTDSFVLVCVCAQVVAW